MAITTQDGLVSALGGAQRLTWVKGNVTAVAGRPTSLWSGAGQPGVGSTTIGQAASGAVPTDADTGAMAFTNPVSGNSYIGRISGNCAADGEILLVDLLWVWGSGGSGWSVTTTTGQNTTAPTALTRPDSTGANTIAFMEVLATMGAGTATPVIAYTDQGGAAGTSSGMTPTYAASSIIGSVYFFNLAAGDTGVRSIQTLTTSVSMTSGTARICIGRIVTSFPVMANRGFIYNAYDLGMPRVYDDACLMPIIIPQSTASGPLILDVSLIQG